MKNSTVAYSTINLLGLLFVFFVLSSIEHQKLVEERFEPDFGDGLKFIYYVVPTFVVCLSVILAWLAVAAVDFFRRHEYAGFLPLSIFLAAWVVLYLLMRTGHIPTWR